MKQAGQSRARLEFIDDQKQRGIIEHFLGRFEADSEVPHVHPAD